MASSPEVTKELTALERQQLEHEIALSRFEGKQPKGITKLRIKKASGRLADIRK